MSPGATPVAITGMGLWCSVGSGVSACWDSLRAGASGIAHDERMAALGLRCQVSGRVRGVDEGFAAIGALSRDERVGFGRYAKLGFVAAFEALRDAGMIDERLGLRDAARASSGVAVGTGIGPISELEDAFRRAFAGKRSRSPGHAVGLVLPSFLPGFLGEKLGAGVGRGSVSLACNSGLVALEQGWRAVREGGARWFLAGGVEEDSPHTWWAFDGMRALARSATDGADPSRASRPFSHDAHGIVPAGAASFVVLEALDRAIARGATVHAVLHACRHEGSSGREPFTAFEPAAYARVASDALAQGGVPPGAVDLVTGHTHSTRADCDELRALDPLLDLASRGVRVNTPKSLVGHSLGASGLVDVIHLAMQLRRQHALGNHHITALPPDAERFARNVLLPPAPAALRFALKVGYAAGGSYAAVVLGSGP